MSIIRGFKDSLRAILFSSPHLTTPHNNTTPTQAPRKRDEVSLQFQCSIHMLFTYSLQYSPTYHYITLLSHNACASRSTTQHHAAPPSTTQHHAGSLSTTQHHAAPRNTTQHHATPRSITVPPYPPSFLYHPSLLTPLSSLASSTNSFVSFRNAAGLASCTEAEGRG